MKLKEKKSRPKPTNCGRFQKKGIKVVGKWKEVKIDPNMFITGIFITARKGEGHILGTQWGLGLCVYVYNEIL